MFARCIATDDPWLKGKWDNAMKEYQSIRTRVIEFPERANDEAKNDWKVLSVLPAQYVPVNGTTGLELTEIVILFERED